MTRKRRAGPPAAGTAAVPRRPMSGHWALVAILAAGIAVRLWNVGWGLPYLYEEAIPLRFGMKLWPSLPPSTDYHFFVYPAFSYYLQLFLQFLHFCAGYATGSYGSLAAFIAAFDVDPTAFAIVARCATIAFDAGIVAAAYAVLNRSFGRSAAIIAAAFIAFNVLHVRQSHLINVDTLLAFFSVATLYCCIRLRDEPSARWYAAGGAAIGLAAASKYNGAILAIALLAAHLLSVRRPADALRPPSIRNLLLGGIAAAGVFLLFNPLIIPHFHEFLEKFRTMETHMEEGHLGLDPGTSTISYYLLESLPANLGIPMLIAALASAAWLAARRERGAYLLLVIPALDLVMLATWKMRADRYIFPAVPFLLMIAAAGTAHAAGALAARFRARGAGPTAGPPRYIAGAIVLLFLAPQLRSIVEYQRRSGLPDTRTAAKEWIERNFRQGSTIASGPFGIELSKTRYISLPIQFSAVYSERMTPFYNPQWYRDVDLLVISDFDYGRYRLEPDRFRTILGYLDTLRAGWTLVRSFEPGDSMNGPSIMLYRYPGSVGDDPYPPEVLGQLLSSDLETERKVFFLGKLGLIESVNGRLTRSEQLFREVLDLEPGNETARKSLRDILAFRASSIDGRRGPLGGATAPPGASPAPAGPAEEREAGRQDPLVDRGDSLYAAGNLNEAERAYRDALAKDSLQVNAYLGLTMIYAARDDRAGAARTLRDLLRILPPGSDDYERVEWELKSIENNRP